jgi:hypothetical protein
MHWDLVKLPGGGGMSLRPINFIDGAEDELLGYLDAQPNKSRYVKELIKKDMGMPTTEQLIVEKIVDKIEGLLQIRIQQFPMSSDRKPINPDLSKDISDTDLRNIRNVMEGVGAI